MTIHLTPLPHDSHAESSSESAPRRAAHLIVASAGTLAGIALALVLMRQGGIDPVLAAMAGTGFGAWALLMHWIVTRPHRARIEPQTRPRKRRERRPPTEAVPPELMTEKSVEPSDLARALLARIEQPRAPQATLPQPAETAPRDTIQTVLAQTIARATPSADAQLRTVVATHSTQPDRELHRPDRSAPAPSIQAQAWPSWGDEPAIVAQSLDSASAQQATNVAGLAEANLRQVAAPETEFERVERLVKRLADNVNQLESARSHAAPSEQLALDLSNDPATELAASISALKRANQPVEPAAPPTPAPETDAELPIPGADPETAITRVNILAALNEQRIDVFLEPILDLGNQRPQHYEVSIALRTLNGRAINLAEAARDLSGTGLLPLIDQVRISRASQMARKLAERGKAGAVFADLSGETLHDGNFKDTFAEAQRPVGAFPGQLVLTLPQAHVMTFTTADWHTLDRLAEAGFGFALSDVTTLDMDFASLAAQGFTFARLDVESFLIGLPTATGIVPPADICRHLASCGLALIVGGIVEDHQLARIYGFGVLFGQGKLFGGPRAVKPQAIVVSAAAAE